MTIPEREFATRAVTAAYRVLAESGNYALFQRVVEWLFTNISALRTEFGPDRKVLDERRYGRPQGKLKGQHARDVMKRHGCSPEEVDDAADAMRKKLERAEKAFAPSSEDDAEWVHFVFHRVLVHLEPLPEPGTPAFEYMKHEYGDDAIANWWHV